MHAHRNQLSNYRYHECSNAHLSICAIPGNPQNGDPQLGAYITTLVTKLPFSIPIFVRLCLVHFEQVNVVRK